MKTDNLVPFKGYLERPNEAVRTGLQIFHDTNPALATLVFYFKLWARFKMNTASVDLLIKAIRAMKVENDRLVQLAAFCSALNVGVSPTDLMGIIRRRIISQIEYIKLRLQRGVRLADFACLDADLYCDMISMLIQPTQAIAKSIDMRDTLLRRVSSIIPFHGALAWLLRACVLRFFEMFFLNRHPQYAKHAVWRLFYLKSAYRDVLLSEALMATCSRLVEVGLDGRRIVALYCFFYFENVTTLSDLREDCASRLALLSLDMLHEVRAMVQRDFDALMGLSTRSEHLAPLQSTHVITHITTVPIKVMDPEISARAQLKQWYAYLRQHAFSLRYGGGEKVILRDGHHPPVEMRVPAHVKLQLDFFQRAAKNEVTSYEAVGKIVSIAQDASQKGKMNTAYFNGIVQFFRPRTPETQAYYDSVSSGLTGLQKKLSL